MALKTFTVTGAGSNAESKKAPGTQHDRDAVKGSIPELTYSTDVWILQFREQTYDTQPPKFH